MLHRNPIRALLKVIALLAVNAGIAGADTRATMLRVVDGDTLKVSIQGKDERIRLIGIDTPEKEENQKALRDSVRTKMDLTTIYALGRQAMDHMESLVRPNDELRLEFDAEHFDKYGRTLAYVYTKSGVMLNEQMVLDGFASLLTIPPNTRYQKRFQSAFQLAQSKHRGLWGQKK